MQQTQSLLEELKSFIEKKVEQSDVPGIEVAIVKDNEVIFSEGFGYKNLIKKEKVAKDTIFPIASMTKSFVTAGVSVLADEKKVDWDAPVRDVYPEFRLKDPFASERSTLRDLASHRTGLPRHDLVWYTNKSLSKADITRKLAYLQPFSDFRTTYHYQNMMYTTLGNVIERVSGERWDQFVQKRILDKLGMTSTSFVKNDAVNKGNCASPYAKMKGEVKEIPFYFDSEPEAAGSMESNVLDIAKWLLLHINNGSVNGEQLLSEQEMNNLHNPNIIITGAQALPFDEMLHPAYCLGWMTRVYRGHRELHHGGNIDGFSTFMSFLPKEKIGVVVLSNLNSNVYPQAITYSIYDRLLDLQPEDWVKRFNDRLESLLKSAEEANEEIYEKQVPDTTPSHQLLDYVGTYTHEGYGTVTVTIENDHLHIKINDLNATTSHYHYDSFLVVSHDHGTEFVFVMTFSTDSEGNIESVTTQMDPTPGIDLVPFKRQQ